MEKEMDVVVVGGGINGSWAALHLATMGVRTMLIEQFRLGHDQGSSHGASRITRRAYPQPFYMRMMDDSYEQWANLEKESNTKLFTRIGMVTLGPSSQSYVSEVLANVNTLSPSETKRFKVMDSSQANSKMGDFLNIKPSWSVCLDDDGGVLHADLCLKTVQLTAEQRGCTMMEQTEVVNVDLGDCNHLKVVCSRKSDENVQNEEFIVKAKAIVLALGPWALKWSGKNLGLELPLKPILVPVFYFKSSAPLPHCLIILDEGINVYILPAILEDGGHGIKIGIHDGPDCDPDDDNREAKDIRANRDIAVAVVSAHLREVEPVVVKEELCMYTNSPDEVHILDRHPRHANVIVSCGFSGTGFKMAPTNGRLMADLAVNNQPKFDITPFSINRFRV